MLILVQCLDLDMGVYFLFLDFFLHILYIWHNTYPE